MPPMSARSPRVPQLSHRTPRGMPSAAALKRQINNAAKSKQPKKSYLQLLADISASHPDEAKPPADLGTPPAEQMATSLSSLQLRFWMAEHPTLWMEAE